MEEHKPTDACDVQEVTSWSWDERGAETEYQHKRCLTHDEDVA